jgi:hypothetical protein
MIAESPILVSSYSFLGRLNDRDSDHSLIFLRRVRINQEIIPMQTANTQRAGAETNKFFTGPCPGYGTRADCPPLIVHAVLSVQLTEPNAGASR